MADTVQLLKIGVRFSPPALVLTYKDWKSGKMRRRSMPLRNFSKHTTIERISDDLKENPRHAKFIKLISPAQLQRLLTIVKDRISGLSLEASLARNNEMDSLNPEENLNKVDEETLKRKKLVMNNSFERNQKKLGDPEFEYNVEVDFEAGAIETSGWDSGDNSDMDF